MRINMRRLIILKKVHHQCMFNANKLRQNHYLLLPSSKITLDATHLYQINYLTI